jgi:hypothetical protein
MYQEGRPLINGNYTPHWPNPPLSSFEWPIHRPMLTVWINSSTAFPARIDEMRRQPHNGLPWRDDCVAAWLRG